MGLFKKYINQTRKPEGFLGKMMIGGMNGGHAKLADWGMSYLTIAEPSNIAELGCGGGRNTGELLKQYPSAKVTALDYSELSVEKTKDYNKDMIASGRCKVVQGNVAQLPFSDGEFELATAFETVYFWPGPLESFREVYRVLAPGGLFMISNEAGAQKELPVDWTRWVEGMRYYDKETLTRLLEQAGFSIERIDRREKLGWLCVLARK